MELKQCPFCGGKVELFVSDREGNLHDDEYEKNPWSGLAYQFKHEEESNKNCPIATHEYESLGIYLYDSREEAAAAWNKRTG